jgi:hypothetical protein
MVYRMARKGEVLSWTRTHKNLEWFRLPEHSTLRPVFMYCSSEGGVQSLRKFMSVCCLRRASKLELVKLEKACLRWNALLGRCSCPFIEQRTWFTMYGSRVAYTVRLRSGLHRKSHESLAL